MAYITNIELDIFLSIPEDNNNIQFIRNNLISLGYKIIDRTIYMENQTNYDENEFEYIIKRLINNAKYIFICQSKLTYSSYLQIKELNEIIENNHLNKNNIFYLILDPHIFYSKKNISFPINDLTCCYNTLQHLIKNMNIKND
jgi:hypothetical protein